MTASEFAGGNAPEEEHASLESQPPSQNVRGTPTPWVALLCGVVFGLCGALLALRDAAQQTLPHILIPNTPMDFQEVRGGLPVPHTLNWNVTQITALQFIAELNFGFLALGALLLLGGLLLCSISALNPTFSLFRNGAPGETPGFARWTLVGTPLRKVFRSSLIPTLFFLVVWFFTERSGGRIASYSNEIRLVAIGIALWIAFHRYGIAGNFEREPLQPLRGALSELILTGAGFGLTVYIAAQTARIDLSPNLLDRYQMLGTFHNGYWNFLVGRSLFSTTLVWSGAGVLLVALARPLRAPARAVYLLLTLLIFGGGYLIQRPLRPDFYVRRLDMSPEIRDTIAVPYTARYPSSGVPQGIEAAHELARHVQSRPVRSPAELPDHAILLFSPQGIANVRQAGYTEDGLPPDPALLHGVHDFLEQRDYQTALSWTAVRHLFNVHLREFDTTAAMQDLLTDLTRCPHLAQSDGTLVTMLSTCAASPQNLRLLDQFADTKQFAFPDRESIRLMGNLYRRFGVTDRAMYWYRRAEMPQTFLQRVRSDRPMFNAGRISGTLSYNGKPLTGVRVAVEPFRQNGLTHEMEALLLVHLSAMLGTQSSHVPLFAPFKPTPFAFRWLSASALTDAKGAFTIEHLIEGAYWLLIRLPENQLLTPLYDPALHIDNAPKLISVNYAHPTSDLGTIALHYPQGTP